MPTVEVFYPNKIKESEEDSKVEDHYFDRQGKQTGRKQMSSL